MRTNQISRKEKVIHKLERLPAKKIPIVDFYNPKEFKQPERNAPSRSWRKNLPHSTLKLSS